MGGEEGGDECSPSEDPARKIWLHHFSLWCRLPVIKGAANELQGTDQRLCTAKVHSSGNARYLESSMARGKHKQFSGHSKPLGEICEAIAKNFLPVYVLASSKLPPTNCRNLSTAEGENF